MQGTACLERKLSPKQSIMIEGIVICKWKAMAHGSAAGRNSHLLLFRSPAIFISTFTTGFTFNRKLLGSLIPH